jgi:2,3-bisphosphoglycerate-dependent phosphoglycerate mutase
LQRFAARASRSSDSGSAGSERLPGPFQTQWLTELFGRVPPVTHTAARQSRSRTGFPDLGRGRWPDEATKAGLRHNPRVVRPCYLVRHGQSDWNVLELTQGQTMSPRLTDLGRDQARTSAALIRADLGPDVAVDLVVTSDLVRAHETAEILADLLGGELRLDVRLREQHLGDLEGRSYAETWTAAEAHDWSDPHLPVAGGESPHQLLSRIADAVDSVDPTLITVLVSHGDAIRAAVAHLAGIASQDAPWVDVRNGSVARVSGHELSWLTP